jgi:site-specific recombinase XerD
VLEKSFGIIFYLKKRTAGCSDDERFLYLRVTVNGIAKDISTRRIWYLSRWNSELKKATGNTEQSKSINSDIETLTTKVYQARKVLLDDGREVSADAIKDLLLGRSKKGREILRIFQEHNDKVAALVGIDYAYGTFERYETTLDHSKAYILWKYQAEDVDIRKLDYEFISDFEFWLKVHRKCSHNTTMKYIANFKKVVLQCVRNGWIVRDPFHAFKITKREVDREALSEDELEVVRNAKFESERISEVRDVFLFSCYTGLAYVDLYQLKKSNLVKGIDGALWVRINRQKTESLSRIPLLPYALEVIERYNSDLNIDKEGKALPVLSNQKMNKYLKDIARYCGINKNITCHIARHTFATTVTLTNGVPIETVSKMLGHVNIKTTEQYAKVVDKKISIDMANLVLTLGSQNALHESK